MSQAELAQRMGRPLQVISEIVQGKKAITAETALQLERATGVPASFWNSAQRNHEAAVARLAEERDLKPDSAWLDRFPLRALIKLGHIPASGSAAEQMRALLNFFGVAGKKEWESIWTAPAVAFRKSTAFEASPMAVAAWLRLGERLAQQVRTEPYNQDRFVQSLSEIRKLTRAEPHVFATETVKRFAAELEIPPGIVVGRLQHERLVPFTHLNALKRHFRLKDPTE